MQHIIYVKISTRGRHRELKVHLDEIPFSPKSIITKNSDLHGKFQLELGTSSSISTKCAASQQEQALPRTKFYCLRASNFVKSVCTPLGWRHFQIIFCHSVQSTDFASRVQVKQRKKV